MLRFDTLDKKPKLWNLAAVFAIYLAALFLMILIGKGDLALPACLLTDVFLLTAIVLLVLAFFLQLRYNPYSYNTIYYSGFSLFFASVLIMYIFLTVHIIQEPEVYKALQIIYWLYHAISYFLFFSAPVILIFSAALCISNISLIRHEGKRLQNILGLILALLLIVGSVFLFFFDYYVSGSETEVLIHEMVSGFLSSVYFYVECMLIGTIIANIVVTRYKVPCDKDYVILLGCGIRKDGTPSPLLRGRIDRAIAFRKEQLEKTGKDLIFVTSGGQGPNEVISESAAMKRYLLEQGIPEDRIIEEDRSTSTFENMKFSKEKLTEAGYDGTQKVAFSTTQYHVFRGGLFARRVKMRAVGMGAKTKWYFWPNASVREFIGLLTEHKGKQALILCGILIVNILLTYASIRY